MRFVLFSLLFAATSFANTVTKSTYDKSRYDPTEDEPRLKGTDVPVEKINTAPSPIPQEETEAMPSTITTEKPKINNPRKQSQEEPK